MKRYWTAIGITTVAAALVYPSILLYRFLVRRRDEQTPEQEHHIVKAFVPAYRGEHKHPHRRVNGKKGGEMQ